MPVGRAMQEQLPRHEDHEGRSRYGWVIHSYENGLLIQLFLKRIFIFLRELRAFVVKNT